MPWHAPITWSPGTNDQPTTTQLNQQLRDNQAYLLDQRSVYNTPYFGGAISGTPTTFTAVDTTNARIGGFAIAGTRVRGFFQFPFSISFSVAGVAYCYFTVYVNGATNLGDASYGITLGTQLLNVVQVPFFATSLTAGSSPNFDLYWKLVTISGTVSNMTIASALSSGSAPMQKFAWEC